MPDKDESGQTEGSELVNLSQLAEALGVTRQWLHTLRTKDPEFPPARRKPGSTRDVWDLAEARAYYKARELQPGARTDLRPKE